MRARSRRRATGRAPHRASARQSWREFLVVGAGWSSSSTVWVKAHAPGIHAVRTRGGRVVTTWPATYDARTHHGTEVHVFPRRPDREQPPFVNPSHARCTGAWPKDSCPRSSATRCAPPPSAFLVRPVAAGRARTLAARDPSVDSVILHAAARAAGRARQRGGPWRRTDPPYKRTIEPC